MAELSGPTLQALQMIMAGGQDIAQGTGGTNLGAAVQGNIQSRSMLKLLQTLLGPDGTKATFSNAGMNLTVPKETTMFKNMLGGGNFTVDQTLAPVPSATPNSLTSNYITGGGASTINPFAEGQPSVGNVPAITGADLAGLSAKDISTALGLKQTQDQLKQQSFRDLVDSTYKNFTMRQAVDTHKAEIAYKEALTKQSDAATKENTPSIDVTLTDGTAVKLYEYAKKQGFTGSIVDFKNADMTTHQKDYKAAVAGGYKGDFNGWMVAMAKAGAVNLGELGKREEQKNSYQGEKYFSNPDWTKDLQNHIGSKDIQNRITDVQVPVLDPKATKEQKQAAYSGAVAKERAKVKIEFIEGKIAAGGGKVIANPVMGPDGKTVTWKVQWPTGNTTDVTQAIR
jgi:hypothetical protein